MEDLAGICIGRYKILSYLGGGGMADVYLAEDTNLGRTVAIKFSKLDTKDSSKSLDRFDREAKALAQLSHPNIVTILEYGNYQNMPYIVMEYIKGGTLAQRLGKPIPWHEACKLLAPVARAVKEAHDHKLVHRDIKPSNILINESGQPMLSDFGIVKVIQSEETRDLTGTGHTIGTTSYMAPEQAQGKAVDGRADIYSLGVVLFEMVTGTKPYTARNAVDVALKHISDPIPNPRGFVHELPPECEQIIYKAMAKKPEDRFQDAGFLAKELENHSGNRNLKSQPQKIVKPVTQPKPIDPVQEKSRKSKKFPLVIAGLLLLGLVAMTGYAFFTGVIPPGTPAPVISLTSKPIVTAAASKAPIEAAISAAVEPSVSDLQTATLTSDPTDITSTPVPTATASPTPPLPTSIPVSANALSLANISKVEQLKFVEKISVIQVNWSPDNRQIAVAGGKGITFIDANTFRISSEYSIGTIVKSVFYQSDSANLFFAQDNRIGRLDLESKKIIDEYDSIGSISSIALSPDNSLIAAGLTDNKVLLINTADGNIVRTMRSNFGNWAVSFSPDGKTIASGTSQGVLMWDVKTGSWLPILTGQKDLIKTTAFSHDSELLVAGGQEILRVWNTSTGSQQVIRQNIFKGNINAVAFSADNHILVTGSDDGIVRFIDLTQSGGSILREIKAHTSAVKSLYFSPDGSKLITGSNEGIVRLWGIP